VPALNGQEELGDELELVLSAGGGRTETMTPNALVATTAPVTLCIWLASSNALGKNECCCLLVGWGRPCARGFAHQKLAVIAEVLEGCLSAPAVRHNLVDSHFAAKPTTQAVVTSENKTNT